MSANPTLFASIEQKQHEIQLKFDGMATQLQATLLRSKEELHDAFQEDINTQASTNFALFLPWLCCRASLC
jgi:hypothetical protein